MKSKRKLVLGGIIGVLLIFGITLGVTTNFMGKFTPKLNNAVEVSQSTQSSSYDGSLNYVEMAEESMGIANRSLLKAKSAYKDVEKAGDKSKSADESQAQAELAASNAESAATDAQSYVNLLDSYVSSKLGSVAVVSLKAELSANEGALESLRADLVEAEADELEAKERYDSSVDVYSDAYDDFRDAQFITYEEWGSGYKCYYDGSASLSSSTGYDCQRTAYSLDVATIAYKADYDIWWDALSTRGGIEYDIVLQEIVVEDLEEEYAKYDTELAQEYADLALSYAVEARGYVDDIAEVVDDTPYSGSNEFKISR